MNTGKETDGLLSKSKNRKRYDNEAPTDSCPASSNSQRERHMAEQQQRIDATSQKRAYFTAAILCFINLLNYMDRYTIAGYCIYFMICYVLCLSLEKRILRGEFPNHQLN